MNRWYDRRKCKPLINERLEYFYITDNFFYLNKYHGRILTVWGFIFPVIKANKSVSDMEMVQSAFLSVEQNFQINNFKIKRYFCWNWHYKNPKQEKKLRQSFNLNYWNIRDNRLILVWILSPVSLWTLPFPFFTSTNQVASCPFGPSLTLKAKTPPIFFTNCSPS